MKADKPEFLGTVVFDGTIQVTIPRHGVKTLRTDLGGLGLQKANPNKELLVLTRNHVGYDEIDTGYIVRTKQYDQGRPRYFGLKADPDSEYWGCHNYCDVIAWGYADGGLNDPTLFYSCQSTPEEEAEREKYRAEHGMKTHAERLAEMQNDEPEDDDDLKRRGVAFRIEDGEIHYNAVVGSEEKMTDNATDLMRDAGKNFYEFRKQHPEVTEMHFYTDDEVKVND